MSGWICVSGIPVSPGMDSLYLTAEPAHVCISHGTCSGGSCMARPTVFMNGFLFPLGMSCVPGHSEFLPTGQL